MKPLVSDPLVVLNAEGEWSADHDVLIRYSAVPEFPSSAWDWIGLFQVMLPHLGSSAKLGNVAAGGPGEFQSTDSCWCRTPGSSCVLD